MKKVILLASLLLGFTVSYGQVANSIAPSEAKKSKLKLKKPPKDGFIVRNDVDSTSMVPYAEVRDEDVFYAKRLWREIDLRDTLNTVFKMPKSRLMDILMEAIKAEELTAYSPKGAGSNILDDDDSFTSPLSVENVLKNVLGSVQITNSKTGEVKDTVNDYNPELFTKFRIKEDWILDVRRSVFEARIIGLAPLKLDAVTNNWQPVFWVYYPEAREILSKKRVMTSNNDASVLSYDDVFIRRLFASYVTKETNPSDSKIKDLIDDPKLRLYESERIKTALSEFDQGLWEY